MTNFSLNFKSKLLSKTLITKRFKGICTNWHFLCTKCSFSRTKYQPIFWSKGVLSWISPKKTPIFANKKRFLVSHRPTSRHFIFLTHFQRHTPSPIHFFCDYAIFFVILQVKTFIKNVVNKINIRNKRNHRRR